MKFHCDLLRSEMRRHNLSPADLARRLQRYDDKASRALVHYWLCGKALPSLPYMMALCEIFNKSAQDFYK